MMTANAVVCQNNLLHCPSSTKACEFHVSLPSIALLEPRTRMRCLTSSYCPSLYTTQGLVCRKELTQLVRRQVIPCA
jgi:hypothetical protein